MPASPIDSALYGNLFRDPELAQLFTDTAEIRAMLLVEGALAKAQGELGMIPKDAADFLARATAEIQIDPAALAEATGKNAVPVPGLVKAARKEMGAPEHAAYLHFGATSQDIMDTGLTLRLRQVVRIFGERLKTFLGDLGALAEAHAELPTLARTYGQPAVPTSFGAIIAAWGTPFLRYHERLIDMKPRLLSVSLSGAAGTLASMGEKGPTVRQALAKELKLTDPETCWHANRDRITEFAGWMTGMAVSLGKMAEDLILMAMRSEVRLAETGGSSTMPHKENPVGASAISALARHATTLNSALQNAAIHREARDGAAWMGEWLSLSQLVLTTGQALRIAQNQFKAIEPNIAAMQNALATPPCLWAAEAITFALAKRLPRPDAEAIVSGMIKKAVEDCVPLPKIATAAYPDICCTENLAPDILLGEAPTIARNFINATKTLPASQIKA